MTHRTPVRTALRVLFGPYKAVRTFVDDWIHDLRSVKLEKQIARQTAANEKRQEQVRERALEASVRSSLIAQIELLLEECIDKMRPAGYKEDQNLHLDFHMVYEFLYLTIEGKVIDRYKKEIFFPMMTNESLTRFKLMLLEAVAHLNDRIAITPESTVVEAAVQITKKAAAQ
ncbi:MAG: hypothetical protein JWM52_705 [Candidatus Saccharibacteria bacterium]|nr:hypothetical protein [Candidatus Saccharibacteria bacterium]